jgi:hypothetical protein
MTLYPSAALRQGLVIVLAAAMPATAVALTDRPPRSDLPPRTSDLRLPAPTSTIHWAVAKDGSVMLSDRPGSGAAQQGVQSFRSYSDPESIARAARERDYWRAQAEAFNARQRERNREFEQRRVVAVPDQADYGYPRYFAVPGYLRYQGPRPFPPAGVNPGPSFGTGAPFTQSHGAAPGQGPAPFLSSGFATGLRR